MEQNTIPGALVAAALVKAQRAFGPALKTHTNPAFKSKYADLSACVEAVVDALNSAGIALVQRNIACETGVCVETVFVHESGEQLSSGPLHVPAAKHDPQGYGSALTYARRYSLMAACGIAPEDDDGNAGAKAKREDRAHARAKWLADWLIAIETAANVGDAKRCVEEAITQARTEGDAEAEAEFLAASRVKAAALKAKAAGKSPAQAGGRSDAWKAGQPAAAGPDMADGDNAPPF